MRVVLQRVSYGNVSVGGELISEIGPGVVLLVGVGPRDSEVEAHFLAEKIAKLRIFEDDQGKMNLSLLEVGGEALVVSQFTLYANTDKGRRPSFVDAAPPETASPLIDRFSSHLNNLGIPTKMGVFGASMQVEIHNAGPVTILLDREP